MNFQLELLTLEDAMYMGKVHEASFPHPWSDKSFEDLMTRKHAVAIGATHESNLLGFILGNLVHDEAEILTLAVSPPYRRFGCALKLLEEFERYVAKHGATKIFLEVAMDNEAALGLYRRQHYKRIGTRQNYYLSETGMKDALTMVKRLY